MTRTSAPSDAACENPRRTALLDAATSVLATSGLRGLTHRAVDRQAGFPEGTCSVSFRTRAALLAGLTTHVGSRVAVQVRALGEQIPSGTDDPLARMEQAGDLGGVEHRGAVGGGGAHDGEGMAGVVALGVVV